MKTLKKYSILAACACACLMVPTSALAEAGKEAPQTAPASVPAPASTSTKVDSPIVGAEDFEECRVAVIPFKSETMKDKDKEIDPGKTIARILEGRLNKKRFVIMSRDLGDVITEQNLNNGANFSDEGASNKGELDLQRLLPNCRRFGPAAEHYALCPPGRQVESPGCRGAG